MKKIILGISSLALAYGILIISVSVYEYRTLYHPEKGFDENLIDRYQLEELWIETEHESKIHAIYKQQSTEIVDLFLHGNAGNISRNEPNIQYLEKSGISYLMIDYPGYGKSKGTPSESSLYQSARAAYEFLIKEKNWEADQIIINGQSLGGAVAIELASQVPCRSLIVESSFTSTHDMAGIIMPWIPIKYLSSNKFESIEKIDQVRCPVLILHGDQDRMIPLSMAQALFEQANEPKYYITLPEFGHNDRPFDENESTNRKIMKFIRANQITQLNFSSHHDTVSVHINW